MTLVVEGADKKRETIEVKAPVKPLGGDGRAEALTPGRRGAATPAYRFSAFSASLMPSLTPTSAGSAFSACAASRSL